MAQEPGGPETKLLYRTAYKAVLNLRMMRPLGWPLAPETRAWFDSLYPVQ